MDEREINNRAFGIARAAYGTGAMDDSTLEALFPQLREDYENRLLDQIIGTILEIKNSTLKRPENYDEWIALLQRLKKAPKPDTYIRDTWEYVHEFVRKFGRIPTDEDELVSLVDYVIARIPVETTNDDNYCENNCKGYQETGKCYCDGECLEKHLADIAKEVTKDKETALKFLKSAGIVDESGELAEMYRPKTEDVTVHEGVTVCEDVTVYRVKKIGYTHGPWGEPERFETFLGDIYTSQEKAIQFKQQLDEARDKRNWHLIESRSDERLNHDEYVVVSMPAIGNITENK